jgi:hypothetical protein
MKLLYKSMFTEVNWNIRQKIQSECHHRRVHTVDWNLPRNTLTVHRQVHIYFIPIKNWISREVRGQISW